MLEQISQRFHGSCMMLVKRSENEVEFLGSCFLVHSDGYVLTTSRVATGESDLFVVPPDIEHSYPSLSHDEVTPIPVDVVSRDVEHDIALLKMRADLQIQMPSNVLGNPEDVGRGGLLFSLGIPFGYYRLHGVMEVQSILSGRLMLSNGTKCLVFDRHVHFGDCGGPLIAADAGQIIGVVGGGLDPVSLGAVSDHDKTTFGLQPALSYAVSLEYGVRLLHDAGVTPE
ncbi:MAG: trypsin-like peptidase domain-containing protein [Spirochaetia bacterium]